ncbi:hypothetical protein [Agromyces sp. NPDC055661]
MPTLSRLLSRVRTLDPDATIFAEQPWGEESRAILISDAVDDALDEPQRMAYLLEVDLALDVLKVWSDWRNGKVPTPAESVAAVIHYAQQDAYIPVAPHET